MFRLFLSARMGLLAFSFLWAFSFQVQAQYTGDPEDYYLGLYYSNPYLAPPPPQVIVDGNVNQVITQAATFRVARVFQVINQITTISRGSFQGTVFQPQVEAGGFESLDMSIDFSHTRVDDNVMDVKGDTYDSSFLVSGQIGEGMRISLTGSHSRYHAGNYLQECLGYDLLLNYAFNDAWALGAFINNSFIDIEDVYLYNSGSGEYENAADSFSRWGGGLLASWNSALWANANFGVVNALTSMNKSSVGRLGDDEDSAWLCMLSFDQGLTKSLSANLSTTFLFMLDRAEDAPDGSYAIHSAGLTWRATSALSSSLGFETTSGDNDRQESRFIVGMIYEF